MTFADSSSFLIRLAQIFREEGDAATAEELDRQEHMVGLAHRLEQRGQVDRAVRLYERCIERRLRGAAPDDLLAMLDLRRYARTLMQAGRQAAAARYLRGLVLMRNRRLAWDDDQLGLLQALQDRHGCLTAIRDQRSVREAAALVDSVKRTIESRGPEARR